MNTLGKIVSEVLRTGKSRALAPSEVSQIRAEFSSSISPEIERLRNDRIRAWAECKDLVVD